MQNLKLDSSFDSTLKSSNHNILSKLETLDSVEFSNQEQIHNILNSNYSENDILINPHSNFKITKSAEQKYFALGDFNCSFPKESNIPEIKWNHISGSLLLIISNQIGKMLHCSVGHTNGVNLLRVNMKISKAAPIADIKIATESDLFAKMGLLWAKSTVYFFSNQDKFAEINFMTHGVGRSYD